MARGSKKEDVGIGELLAYAGDRKFLTYLGMALSAISQLLSFGPYVCIWFVARDLIVVAPNWRGYRNCSVRLVGRGLCLGKHRPLFRGTHVHALVCFSLRVQHSKSNFRAFAQTAAWVF